MFAALSAALLIIKWITLRCKSFLYDQSLLGEILMKCVHTFGTGRHKRQADITFLFEYIYTIGSGARNISIKKRDYFKIIPFIMNLLNETMPFVMDKSKSENGAQYQKNLPYLTEVQ